ncbi:AMP deaminase 2 [Frankliniella fusca]|uniref:AMP deaminase 2 n=1 Tax=Frankliniella fusca TaxID=407009 RepID=A0AAE1GQE7_9NEOP|nr:AMP deaminase 2 [Frankliniella fusca]
MLLVISPPGARRAGLRAFSATPARRGGRGLQCLSTTSTLEVAVTPLILLILILLILLTVTAVQSEDMKRTSTNW